ncbi:MAG TPA: ABC transporter permease [Puia sp.]|jgi:ABC-type antimicrobial peptide transport system permease subunit|nr:ABC transporter permease [Puia sp.]
MLKNYIKTALRNLVRNRVAASINIGGLAIGMAVAMLIGLWIWDEVSYDKSFPNHDRIAQVMQNQWLNNHTETWNSESYVMGAELRKEYGSDFKHVIMSGWTYEHLLTYGDKNIKKGGNYMEPGVTDMLSLKMLKGDRNGLKDPASILLSQSTAKAVFGNEDPMGKTLTLDHKILVKVTGVYEDLPVNSSFADLTFIAPWQLFVNVEHWDTRFNNPWGASWFQTFVQIADNADMEKVSAKIRDVKLNAVKRGNSDDARYRPAIFLHPMNKWHLYSDFREGVVAGGRIQYVWLFGIIGIFVLTLACINFMNLSTARSEKRAREVGIRKAIGSMRGQLIAQFYSESVLIALFAFMTSLILMQLSLPFFNEVAGKKMSVMWSSPLFWLACIGFTLITGIIAGSYPALYLSSFRPVKVLKGVFRAGQSATLPRKVLVVVQFAVSIILIIGTVVVFNQVEFAKGRPVGYTREGLVTVQIQTDEMRNNYDAFKNDLLSSGVVAGVAQSENLVTNIYVTNGGLTWKGKDPNLQEEFSSMCISAEFGRTVGWQIKEGRDFSANIANDSSAFVINEAAVQYLGFKDPVGETITWLGNGPMKIIGVVKDMVNQSPYDPVRQMFFFLPRWKGHHNDVVNIRMAPNTNAHQAIDRIGAIYKKYDPSTPFEYNFIDDAYAQKFVNEERVGKLAGCFAFLAVLISCLGLFGMASFMAEQRVKEIGIRKVLGASILNLWRLLSREFVALVAISFVLAAPLAYYFMHHWLHNYEYRTNIQWWVFAATGMGALLITLLTVSLRSIRAASANPIKSLRTE